MAGEYARLEVTTYLIVGQDIAVGDGDADEGADEGDEDDAGGSCSDTFLVGFANVNNSDMPMAPMDMDDEGDVISEGEE